MAHSRRKLVALPLVVCALCFWLVGGGALRSAVCSRYAVLCADQPASEPSAALAPPPRPWTWEEPYQPVNRIKCRWAPFQPPFTAGLPPPRNGSICLRPPNDLLSDAVASAKHWFECADLPALYLNASSACLPGQPCLVLDAGANLGSCSLHMLLATSADVVSFEPGADNLHLFTKSALRIARRSPSARARLVLYPVALGEGNYSQRLYPAVGNAGHSVVGTQQDFYAPSGHEAAESIDVRQLDALLWRQPPPAIALLKLDVEGYECKAVQGMRRLLAARAVRVIKVEVFDGPLRAQGCSGVELQRALVLAGFILYTSADAAPESLLSAEALYMEGEPYNVYGWHREHFSRGGAAHEAAPESVARQEIEGAAADERDYATSSADAPRQAARRQTLLRRTQRRNQKR